MEKTIAIITARGGSKRIPRKNIKDFLGKPIIAYSIEAALICGMFDEVMVSTDDAEIASIAKKYGADVPFMRSADAANDFATTEEVLIEVLEEYKKIGKEYKYMCCIYPTAPFITPTKLIKAMELMEKHNPEQVFPVVEYSFPPQRCNTINETGFLEYRFPEYKNTRTQDLEQWYHDAGQFYVYNIDKFSNPDSEHNEYLPLIIPPMEVQDIDTETDWKIAEMKYTLMKTQNDNSN